MKRTYPAKPKTKASPKKTKKVTKMTTEPTTPAKPQETAAETLGNTRRWARQSHGASTDKAGYPYVVHLDGVARNIYMLVGLDKELIQAGYLHDMIEDTTATTKMLRENGFTDRVIDTVYAVTKISGEANYDYISFIIDSGRDAMIVKLADLKHNTEEARLEHKTITVTVKERLLKKYLPAIWRIERALIALGENITPTVTFEEAKDACTYKPATTTYAPKWRVSTSPSTVVINDYMKFAEGTEEDGDKYALRVKSKSSKNGEFTFTFHDSDSKVTLKQGDSFWIKWGGGGGAYKSTSTTTPPTSSTATPTWTPEWIKYLGLPKDWKDGDDFPDPNKTFRYDNKAKPAGGKGKSSTAPGGVKPLAPPAKYQSTKSNICLECHIYGGHTTTCEYFGECSECYAPQGEPHAKWCTRGDGTSGKDLLVLGNSDDPDDAEYFDPDTGKALGYVPELETTDDKAAWVLSGSEDEGFGRVDGSINYAGPADNDKPEFDFDSDVAIKRTFDDLMREVDAGLDGLDK